MTKRALTITLLALPAFALGACNRGAGNNSTVNSSTTTTTTNAAGTTTQTASAGSTGTAGAVRMEPGEWEMSIEAEGMGPARTNKTCVTPEMADRAAADMANGGGQAEAAGMTCDRSGLQMAGGRMNGTISCTGPNNMRLTTTINGEITPTSIDMRQQTTIPMGGQDRTVNAHITGRRTGECTASTPGAGATASGNAAGGAEENESGEQ